MRRVEVIRTILWKPATTAPLHPSCSITCQCSQSNQHLVSLHLHSRLAADCNSPRRSATLTPRCLTDTPRCLCCIACCCAWRIGRQRRASPAGEGRENELSDIPALSQHLELLYFHRQCKKPYIPSKGDMSNDRQRERESQTVQQRVQD